MIPERLQTVNMRIAEVLYPTLVGRRVKGDGHGFDRALIDSIRYGMIGMLLIAAAGGGAAHAILEVFGPGFSRAAPALAILLLFPALAAITATQTQALWAVERPGVTSFIQLARLAVTIGLTAVLTPRIGIVGPAIAIVAGLLVVLVWNTIALHPFMTQPVRATWSLRERLALLGAYAFGFVVAKLVEHAVRSTGGLLLSLGAGTIAYAAVLFVSGAVNDRDRHRLREAITLGRGWLERRGETDRRRDHTALTGELSGQDEEFARPREPLRAES
jgi:O-antigen/teichoic acid export membrane protein